MKLVFLNKHKSLQKRCFLFVHEIVWFLELLYQVIKPYQTLSKFYINYASNYKLKFNLSYSQKSGAYERKK